MDSKFYDTLKNLGKLGSIDLKHHLPVLKMFVETYGDELSTEILKRCILKMRGRYTIPTLGDLQAELEEMKNLESDSPLEIASKMASAICKFGGANVQGARNYIGEIGWKVVELEGGWGRICRTLQESQMPFVKGQWAKMVESVRHRESTPQYTPKLLKSL